MMTRFFFMGAALGVACSSGAADRIVPAQGEFQKAPRRAEQRADTSRTLLLGHSAFMADAAPHGVEYQPVESGGFRIAGGKGLFNYRIIKGQNTIFTGDRPWFKMHTNTAAGSASRIKNKRFYPLWPRADGELATVSPSMGVLRLGLPDKNGTIQWLDAMPKLQTETTFLPGRTEYQLKHPDWTAQISVSAAEDFHGLLCRVEFDRPMPLAWRYGSICFDAREKNANTVEARGNSVKITEPNLPNGVVFAGWDADGTPRTVNGASGSEAEFNAATPRSVYHIVAVWGVTGYDEDAAAKVMAKLDNPNTAQWPEARERLKKLWFDCYIGRALNPEENFNKTIAAPADAVRKSREWLNARNAEFKINTPDKHFNAVVNYARSAGEYFRKGPGAVLAPSSWDLYAHISTGMHGFDWGGDHRLVEDTLRLYAAAQAPNGFINWLAPSLEPIGSENNTPYWVDQVWRNYTWTGDKQFLKDMFPGVKRAIAWMRKTNDADGDGLFMDRYEYWNADSNGKGPKAVTPTVMSWAMADRAARIATELGDKEAQRKYAMLAEKIRTAVFRELWSPENGTLGSVGADGMRMPHGQVWEQFLAINGGLLSPEQARSATRYLERTLGFEPTPGIKLLSISALWPIMWSNQWVSAGETLLTGLAGMKGGDIELWWPYVNTAYRAAFRNDQPGIRMGISNSGSGGGYGIPVADSWDPHVHSAVRGIFGIEPAIPEGRLDICPAFPVAWNEASIKTPDVEYQYRRNGVTATMTIKTPKPLVKRVRANCHSPLVTTPQETESTVTLSVADVPVAPVAEKRQLFADRERTAGVAPLSDGEKARQVLFDLEKLYNITTEELLQTKFLFDINQTKPAVRFWHTPPVTIPASPKMLETASGVKFLTSGRPEGVAHADAPKNLLALSSWRPYPLPGGVRIPVGMRCDRLLLLMQNCVNPYKNYIPNGEIVLHYADGTTSSVSLVPPYNMDTYFQAFSREGEAVPYGELVKPLPRRWAMPTELLSAHATMLPIRCAPDKELKTLELRATCSQGVIGVVGLTAIAAE